jgi:hypothetical protein
MSSRGWSNRWRRRARDRAPLSEIGVRAVSPRGKTGLVFSGCWVFVLCVDLIAETETPYPPAVDDGMANRSTSAWMIVPTCFFRVGKTVFSVWVTFRERKWIALAQRRGISGYRKLWLTLESPSSDGAFKGTDTQEDGRCTARKIATLPTRSAAVKDSRRRSAPHRSEMSQINRLTGK